MSEWRADLQNREQATPGPGQWRMQQEGETLTSHVPLSTTLLAATTPGTSTKCCFPLADWLFYRYPMASLSTAGPLSPSGKAGLSQSPNLSRPGQQGVGNMGRL